MKVCVLAVMFAAGSLCAGRATGEVRFDEAGPMAFACEESLYDAKEQNWPDLGTGLGEHGRNSRGACPHGAMAAV